LLAICFVASTSSFGLMALVGLPATFSVVRRAPSRRMFVRRLVALAPVALGAAALRLFTASSAAVGASLATRVSLASHPLARIGVAALLSTWLSSSLGPAQIASALLALGFAGQLRDTLEGAHAALGLRAGFRSIRALRSSIGALGGVVLVRALDRGERASTALLLRGGARTTEVDAPRGGVRLALLVTAMALVSWLGGRS
jgi:hypothetical protein